MTDWDDEATRLLELARHGHDPTEQDHARIAAAFAARCLVEPGLLAGKAASGFTLKATLGKGIATTKLASFKLVGLPLWAAFGLGVSAGAVTGAVAFYGSRLATSVEVRPAPERPRAAALSRDVPSPGDVPSRKVTSTFSAVPSFSAARPSASEAAPAAAIAAARVASTELPVVAPRARTASPALAESAPASPALASSVGFATPEPTAPPNPLAIEVRELRRAQQFLHAGDAARSLSVLDAFAREHAVSALREELQATRAMALCTLGRGSPALASDFERRFPGSVHLEPVRAACEAQGKSPSAPTDPPGHRH